MSKGKRLAIAAVVIAAALTFAGGWFAHHHTTASQHHGEAYGNALVSGQLLIGNDPQHARPVAGRVGLANIYQVGPVWPTIEVWPDGGFSTYVDPGTYTVFGVSPEYHKSAKACEPYGVSNGTISVTAGDRINIAVLCR
jgi:hypothetical protein